MESDLCEDILALNSSNYQDYYNLGKTLAEQQKWKKAIIAYEQAIDLQNDFHEIYHDYGDALSNLKSWKKAIVAYTKAIKFNPKFSWSHYNLGIAFFNVKKITQAINCYSKAVEIDQSNAQFHYALGQAFSIKKSWSKAALSYQQAIDLGYEQWQIYHEYGDSLLNLEHYDEAIAKYQKAIELNQNSNWSHHNLGVALFTLELFSEAISFFQQAITIDEQMAGSYYYLGAISAQLQQWDQAIAYYHQAKNLKWESPDFPVKLAFALQQRANSDLNSSLELYFSALDNSPNQVEIYQNIANIFLQQDKFAQALFYANEARKLQPESTKDSNLIKLICRRRSKLYESNFDFEVLDYSYHLWRQAHCPNQEKLSQICLALAELKSPPLISIVFPVTESAITWIEDAIAAIQTQVYPYWELCLGIGSQNNNQKYINDLEEDNCSLLKDLVRKYQQQDRRIKIKICSEEATIGAIANQTLNLVQGKFIVLLQDKTLLAPDALWELSQQLINNTNPDIIYADQDCLVWNKEIAKYSLDKPWFKSDWSPDLLLSRNYFGSFVLCRYSLINKVKKFNYNYNSQYIYDLLLKLTEVTENIIHIPKILSHHNQENDSLNKGNIQAVTEALQRRHEPGKVISNPDFPQVQTIRYKITEQALVSIIILTRNLGGMLDKCLESIFSVTTYPNFEVVIVDNGSDEAETLKIITTWTKRQPEKLRVMILDIPFNYSWLNNQAVEQALGDYLLFLNNDTEVISADWIEAMVEQAQRKSIGAVGALLLYPNNTVQHAGIVLGVTGIAGHSHRHISLQELGYYEALVTTANYSAVTAACMMCRRSVFEKVGGFNEQLAVAYNDVDFCLRLKQKGYNNIFLPHVQLYHYESQSRKQEDTLEQKQRIKQEVTYMETTWNHLINFDPGYNINLTREQENYSLNLEPSAEVTAISYCKTKESELWGFFLDEPKLGCVKRKFLDIIGWVVGRIADAIAIEIVANNKVILVTEIKETRPDVAQVYPQIPQAANSGFATSINILDLPQNPELILQAILANETKVKLAKIHLALIINH